MRRIMKTSEEENEGYFRFNQEQFRKNMKNWFFTEQTD
jgi:hypothetical protein